MFGKFIYKMVIKHVSKSWDDPPSRARSFLTKQHKEDISSKLEEIRNEGWKSNGQ